MMCLVFGGFEFDFARRDLDEKVELPRLLAGTRRVVERAEIREDRIDDESRFLLNLTGKRREQVFARVHSAARKFNEPAHEIGRYTFQK